MKVANTEVAPAPTEGERAPAARQIAAIDVGSTSIRMAIAEIDQSGNVRTLERLSQSVNLGKDTFTKGSIKKSTIEECARVLKSYRRILQEYGVVNNDQIRVVATSAVREAENRLAFLDRIYIATGLEIEPLEEADVNRMTYLGIQPYLKSVPALQDARAIVTEVGGGSTEVLLMQGGNVESAHSYRMGSLRLRETLQTFRAPASNLRKIMESHIDRTIDQVVQTVTWEGDIRMIALGGDMRFAVTQLLSEWDRDRIAKLTTAKLEKFTDHMLTFSPDQLVQKYHMSFPDAESLGPALLTYVRLARAFRLNEVHVSNVNLRDGLLKEMSAKGIWSDEFCAQIERAAVELGRKYDFDEAHGRHVAMLSRSMFQALREQHGLERKYEILLYVAAMLHEIGLYVSTASHHKHSMYLINNSELFGLSKRDLLLVALVARYHRRAAPKPTHPGYAALDRDSRVAVSKMAAMLRVVDALDRSRSQRVREMSLRQENGQLVITIPRIDDLSLEQMALNQKGAVFEETFGLKVLLRKG